MKSHTFAVAGILLIVAVPTLWSQKASRTCEVTYVANEGFLLETARHKVLVDALFGGVKGNWCDQPSDSIAHLMLSGKAPFDAIDVVLVTHAHVDHFNAAMTVKFLTNNSKSLLICPNQANEALKGNADYGKVSARVRFLKGAIPFDTTLTVGDMTIRAVRLNHGVYMETDSVTGKPYNRHSGVENFGYFVDMDGFTLSHVGDDSPTDKDLYRLYQLGKREIDAAFFNRTFMRAEGQQLMDEEINAKNFILMHIEQESLEYFKSVVAHAPKMVVFTAPMQRKVFPYSK